MTWLWGAFVSELPRHMVYHEALSASVMSLLMVHQTICADPHIQLQRSQQILLRRSYIDAITSVRLALEKPSARLEPEILCAVFILSSISPYFEGVETVFKNPHAKGAIEILRMRNFSGNSNNDDSFDTFTLSMLRNATALKAIVDGEEGMTPADWDAFENCYRGTDTVMRLLRCVVQIGRVFAYARMTEPQSPEELTAFQQATQRHHGLEAIVLELQQMVQRTQQRNISISPNGTLSPQRPHAQALRVYTGALTVYAQLLCLLQTICPLSSPNFEPDLILLVSRVLYVAQEAKVYRPLGANWVIIALMATWCATMGTPYQMEVAEVMDGWRADGPNGLGKERSVIPRSVLYNWWKRVTLGRGRGSGGGSTFGWEYSSDSGGIWDTGPAASADYGGGSSLVFVPARTALY